MEADVLKIVGQVAGIGGISLGVFLLLFREIIRRKIFPQLTREQAYRLLRTISFYTWTVALAGVAAWVWGDDHSGDQINQIIEDNGTGVIHTGQGNVNVRKELDE